MRGLFNDSTTLRETNENTLIFEVDHRYYGIEIETVISVSVKLLYQTTFLHNLR